MSLPFSKGAINRAGETLRLWRVAALSGPLFAGLIPKPEEIEQARSVLNEYRALWEAPPRRTLVNVSMALREIVRHEEAQISSRLKRADRIINKLVHYPGMKLARMEDVGGCRVVLPNLQRLREVENRIRDRWGEDLRMNSRDDYITNPKDTGYRAVHMVIAREDLMVEVQLRTVNQNIWANVVEDHENRTGEMLKRGVGNQTVLESFILVSEFLAFHDRGEHPPADVVRRLRDLTGTVSTGRR